MRETLQYALGEELHPAFADLQVTLEGDAENGDDGRTGFQLSGANAVWGREGFPFADSYRDLLRTYYGTGVREAAFGTDPEGERQRINEWVAEQTEGKIEELLPGGAVTPGTLLVLVNAIYFSGTWRWQFDPERTTDATFTALDGTESSVPMMHLGVPKTPFASVEGARALELFYRGGGVSMVLILPDEGTFESYERSLDAERLFGTFDDLKKGRGPCGSPASSSRRHSRCPRRWRHSGCRRRSTVARPTSAGWSRGTTGHSHSTRRTTRRTSPSTRPGRKPPPPPAGR
jgi:serpin B